MSRSWAWDAARLACGTWRSGADLAIITSSTENSLILPHVDPQLFDPNSHGTWFGLHDAAQNDVWGDCAGFVNLGAGVNWFDAPCGFLFESVCELAPWPQ